MSKYRDVAVGYEEGLAAGETAKRPAVVTDDHLRFLDALRETGSVNMLASRPHLMAEFPALGDGEAAAVAGYWAKSFGKPNR